MNIIILRIGVLSTIFLRHQSPYYGKLHLGWNSALHIAFPQVDRGCYISEDQINATNGYISISVESCKYMYKPVDLQRRKQAITLQNDICMVSSVS